MAEYYSIVTTAGIEKIALARAGGAVMNYAEIAVGDGGGVPITPNAAQTTLVNEVWRTAVQKAPYVHPNNDAWVVIELTIPLEVGGFTVREMGLFDADGTLLVVGKYPASDKPALGSGSEKEMYLKMIFQVSGAAEVTQTVDSSMVYATEQFVYERMVHPAKAATTANVTLSGLQTIDGVSLAEGDRVFVRAQTNAADNGIYTASADAWVRAYDYYDMNTILPSSQVAVSEGALYHDSLWILTTGGAVTLGTTLLVYARILNEPDVTARISAHAASVNHPAATTEAQGMVELATIAEAQAGTDAARAVTPAGLAAAVPTLMPSASTTVPGKVMLSTATTSASTATAATSSAVKAAYDLANSKVSVTTASVLSATAGASVGAVGTYALLWASDLVSRGHGSVVSGSLLRYASTYTDDVTTSSSAGVGYLNVAPSGSWLLMGEIGTFNGASISPHNNHYASLWLRIA